MPAFLMIFVEHYAVYSVFDYCFSEIYAMFCWFVVWKSHSKDFLMVLNSGSRI